MTWQGAGAAKPSWRRAALVMLTLVVIGVHGCVTQGVAQRMIDFGQAQPPPPPRIEVAYVREMELSAPPVVAPAAPPPVAVAAKPKRPKAPRPASAPQPRIEPPPEVAVAEPPLAAASAPDETASAALASAAPAASDAVASAATAAASDPASTLASATTSASAASAAAFEWPASTRVSYILTGNYRGEVKGSAQVEWIRVGNHYQVHLDFIVGPSFAPVVQRRMTSDGEISAEGLQPIRYDEETKVMLGNWRRRSIVFEPETVLLPNGQRRSRIAGVQDTASQFIQLTYLFSTNPERLKVGNSVDIPLALAHRVDIWTYDVVAEETIHTSFGPLQAFHLKPRRPPDSSSNTLTVEIWFAPQMRYLPARLYVTQDAQTYADLVIDRRPEMAGP
jgi:hypothetical protein